MPRTCFVIMGYHKKTDYPTGRTLDLDKSYRLLVKPAVDECGLKCVRADEITHSGVIDVPMYHHLLESDLVIADLSTSNANALYELGVRHALRPYSTIVIAESKLQYPFDVAHTAIRTYEHLGEAIDYEEVIRFRGELKNAITSILDRAEKDSPVYTYLPTLTPPSVSFGRSGGRGSVKRSAARDEAEPESPAALLDRANAAIDRNDFVSARSSLAALHAMRPADHPWTANDDYVVQRLALATAMSATPDPPTAFAEAHQVLRSLNPITSNNAETIRLWGMIAKGLWDTTHDGTHLENAVLAYERGFCLSTDYENGLNYALVLNVRAANSQPAEAVADFVQARRIRRRVVDICSAQLRSESPAPVAAPAMSSAHRPDLTRQYAVRAALAEALLGLDERDQSNRWREEAFQMAVSEQLKEATNQRLTTLSALVEQSPLRFLTV
jgi:hypothetical protein